MIKIEEIPENVSNFCYLCNAPPATIVITYDSLDTLKFCRDCWYEMRALKMTPRVAGD